MTSENRDEISRGVFPAGHRKLYDDRFRKLDIFPTCNAAIGVFIEGWKLFDVYKPHWNAQIKFTEICYNGRDLTTLSTMRKALRQMDMLSRKKQNLEGVAMPSGIAVGGNFVKIFSFAKWRTFCEYKWCIATNNMFLSYS